MKRKRKTPIRARKVRKSVAQVGAKSPRKRPVPHAFVLEELADLDPVTRSMFGSVAIYFDGKITLILRDSEKHRDDNGVWLATSPEHHESLRREFPSMRTIALLGSKVTAWQNLPADSVDFESAALHVCALVRRRDPRIGKIPAREKRRTRPKA